MAALLLVSLGAGAPAARAGLTSGAFSESGIGARTAGMGGAFSGLADDPYAIAFNPGGLAFQERPAVAFDYTNLYSLDLLKQSYFAGVLPLGRNVHAVAYRNLSVTFDPFPQTYSEGTFFYSFSRRFNNLGVGVTGKYFTLSSDFAQGTASGMGLDVGLLYRFSDALSVGGSIQDLGSSLQFGTGTTESIPQLIRGGVAYRPSERWTITGDVVGERGELFKEIRVGTEYWILSGDRTTANPLRDSIFRRDPRAGGFSLAVRAGLEAEIYTGGATTPAIGLSTGYEGLRFDYSYQFDAKKLGSTNRFSLVYAFAQRFGEEAPDRRPASRRDAPRETAQAARRAASAPSFAVTTMSNATGDASLDWLERGLTEVMAKALVRTGAVDVIPLERVRGAEVLGGNVSARVGASHEMRGTFFRTSPGKIILTIRILDPRGELVEYFSFEAGDADVFALGEAAGTEAARRVLAAR